MQPPLWWGLQALSLAALWTCAGAAFSSSGRVGRHAPYGIFLFVISMGFWFLSMGLAAYMATIAVGAWHGPPGWGDGFTMPGWALLVVSFYLLLLRFPTEGESVQSKPWALGLPVVVGAAFAVAALLRTHSLGHLPTADAAVRTVYLFLDGMSLAVIALSLPVLVRLRRASLGRLYALLGVALVAKCVGDVLFLIWPVENPFGLAATALYPLAGGIAAVALVCHHRAVASLLERRVLADPGFGATQLALRDAARVLRGFAGTLADRLVLDTGRNVLQAHGATAIVRGGVIIATASEEAWLAAVRAAREVAVAVLGRPAGKAFDEAVATYEIPRPEASA